MKHCLNIAHRVHYIAASVNGLHVDWRKYSHGLHGLHTEFSWSAHGAHENVWGSVKYSFEWAPTTGNFPHIATKWQDGS